MGSNQSTNRSEDNISLHVDGSNLERTDMDPKVKTRSYTDITSICQRIPFNQQALHSTLNHHRNERWFLGNSRVEPLVPDLVKPKNDENIQSYKRQGKWAKFSGSNEELAKVALEHANHQASKRRPLLKQISHSMSRRNGFNCQENFDTINEHWVWAPNNSDYNKLQLQAINCSICGNYIRVSDPDFLLPDNIQCICDHHTDNSYDDNNSYDENDGLEDFKEYEYNDENI